MMFNSLALILLTATVFLFFLLILCNWRIRKAYLLRMEGARAMVKKTKKLKAKREEQLKEIITLLALDDSKTESLWLSELEFYQNMAETICSPTDKSLKKVTTLVSDLLTPYHELLNELANSTPIDELTNVIDDAEQNNTNNEFETLKKQYQEKTNENEHLQKQMDDLKEMPTPSSGENNTPAASSELMQLLNQIIIDLSLQTKLPKPQPFEKVSDLKTSYQALLLKIEEKINKMDPVDDVPHQTEGLIEQLRHEKVAYLKKYKRSMKLLFNTYKEYAGAFGLDAPQNPDIEIDDFEKFIDEP